MNRELLYCCGIFAWVPFMIAGIFVGGNDYSISDGSIRGKVSFGLMVIGGLLGLAQLAMTPKWLTQPIVAQDNVCHDVQIPGQLPTYDSWLQDEL